MCWLVITVFLTTTAMAQTPSGAPKSAVATAISPIFGQLVMVSQPLNFHVVHERTQGPSYLREAVPTGETAEAWTQMLTVSGGKDLARRPGVTAEGFARQIAAGFQRACPDTYAGRTVDVRPVSGFETAALVAGCGRVADRNGTRGETALIVVIKGAADVYTVQWAVRGAVASSTPSLDDPAWAQRLATLQPLRLCPIVAGERAPYPSCVNRRD
jgi:hypothetical protein